MYEDKCSYLIIFIYAVSPGKPEIETSEALKQGDNIICRSNGGRPSPQLELIKDGEVVPSDKLPMKKKLSRHPIIPSQSYLEWKTCCMPI